MNSWKTTLTGVLGAVALVVGNLLQSGTVDPKTIIIAVIVAALGVLAKDFNVSGPSK